MGTLDQAFLKAYHKDSATQAAPSTPRAPTPDRTVAAPVPRPHAAFFPAEPQTTQPVNVHRFDPPHATVLTSGPRMLSTERARAAFEVERFTWPAVTALLCDRARSSSLEQNLMRRRSDRAHVLAVAGERAGAGCSTVTLVLARLAATRGLRTAVVEADFRRPQLADMLGIDPPRGWEEVLLGRDPLGEALIESTADRLTLMPLRSRGQEAGPLAGRLAGPLTTLATHHDLVLIDLGAMDNDSAALDAVGLLQGATIDEALIVRDADRTTDNALALVSRRLAAAGISHCSIADNFVRT